ncbi:helix-turn-helix transcriptional regulator [Bradyrhizobium sp. USDA 10063]
MGRKASDGLAYPPRAMRAEQAAAYLSISTSLFYEMVEDERMPPPVKVNSASLWDRLELDAAFENLKDVPGSESSLMRRLREIRADAAKNRKPAK